MVIAPATQDAAPLPMTAAPPAAAPERTLSVMALPSIRPGHVVVEVVGEVDSFTAPLLDACLNSHAARLGTRSLVVDVRRVSFLGGAGVRAVARAERLCRRGGARLSVRCRPGIVEHTLRLAGCGDLVSVGRRGVHRAQAGGTGGRQRRHGSRAVPERSAS